MQPKNSKHLFQFIAEQMESLKNGNITVEVAGAQAQLAKAAIHVMVYEVNRAALLHEIKMSGTKVVLREVGTGSFAQQELLMLEPKEQETAAHTGT